MILCRDYTPAPSCTFLLTDHLRNPLEIPREGRLNCTQLMLRLLAVDTLIQEPHVLQASHPTRVDFVDDLAHL